MLQQEMADLDFDTYFDVTSNPIHPHPHHHQQQPHYDQAIHPTQQLNMPNRFNAPLSIPQLQHQQQQQQYYLPQQQQQDQQQQQQQHQQQPFQVFDWCFKQQQQQQQQPQQPQQHVQMINAGHHTPVSGINQTDSPRPDYFYSAQPQQQQQHNSNSARNSISPRFQMQQRQQMIMKEESFNYNNNYVSQSEHQVASLAPTPANASAVASVPPTVPMTSNITGLPTPMSDVIFPGTPQSRTSIQSSVSNSPCSASEAPANVSPVMEIPPPLTNAFATIDQWGKSNEDEAIPECAKENYHEIRHWRKTKRSDSIGSNTSNMVAAAVAAVAARSAPRNASPVETGRQLKKVAHNAIERRYRNNINDRIRDLKNVVPALYKAKIREKKSSSNSSKSNTEEDEDEAADSSDDETNGKKTGEIVDGVEVAKKLNKATILHKATEYIHHLKHTNELAERENQVLQQILAQMPGGAKVLARFQVQKLDFQQAEQQRLLAERQESMERERAERQRILRERAAQRAALAELLPKPERRPYRRRAKKNVIANDKPELTENNTQQQQQQQQQQPQPQEHQPAAGSIDSQSNTPTKTTPNSVNENNGNKAFMAMFLCLAIVSPLSFENTAAQPYHGGRAISQQQQILVRSLPSTTYSLADYCLWAKFALLALFSTYFLGHYFCFNQQKKH